MKTGEVCMKVSNHQLDKGLADMVGLGVERSSGWRACYYK